MPSFTKIISSALLVGLVALSSVASADEQAIAFTNKIRAMRQANERRHLSGHAKDEVRFLRAARGPSRMNVEVAIARRAKAASAASSPEVVKREDDHADNEKRQLFGFLGNALAPIAAAAKQAVVAPIAANVVAPVAAGVKQVTAPIQSAVVAPIQNAITCQPSQCPKGYNGLGTPSCSAGKCTLTCSGGTTLKSMGGVSYCG
ncbi:hypothetical protein T439DRAFT_192180 [Meredithblackwellia eburnea MCA 4105]